LGLAGLVLVVASLVRTMILTRRRRSPGVQLVGALVVAVLVIWLVQNTFFDQVVWLAVAAATLFSLESRFSWERNMTMTELPATDLGGAGRA